MQKLTLFKLLLKGILCEWQINYKGKVVKDSVQPLMLRSLYNIGGAQFVFPEPAINGELTFKSNNDFKDKPNR